MRSIGNILLAAALCAAAGVAVHAQQEKTKAADLSLTAVGRQHHPIQTSSKEAQEYFDQGLTLIYAFNHEEAARSFLKAAELDPASPMPYWGYAMAIGPNYNADVDAEREKLAYGAAQKAQALAKNSPQNEKDYVAAISIRYTADANPDYKQLAVNYSEAMKALAAKYPDDLDAATLYAESKMNLNPWKLWSNDGKPAEGTLEIVAVLEDVLARNPDHVGANHYYIHAVEASPNPAQALPSAKRLDTAVPKAGHLVHMPAHIYERTGFYEQAAANNVEAAKVDREYAQKYGQTGSMYDLMYHSHNEHFEAMSASMAGNYAQAKKVADAMAARLAPHAAMMPMLDGFLCTPIWVDARFGKWEAILVRPEPAAELLGSRAMWRYSRALAYASAGKVAEAEKEYAEFQKEAAKFPANARFGEMNKASDVLGVASHVIAARIAQAQGNPEKAIAEFTKAVELEDTLNYDEPADWYYPVRESLGGALLQAGKASEAEAVFRADLAENPRNPRSLYGLKEALRAQKKETDAAWVEAQYEKAWKNADVTLTISSL